MDIHAPEKPISNWREFAVHIGVVTIGILIALSLDGIREHFHNRRLVRETRESVRTEMSHDRDQMARELAGVTRFQERLKAITTNMPADLQSNPAQVRQALEQVYNPGYFFSEASWQTALSTGALAHMTTSEVSAYAYAANGLEHYVTLQNEAQRQEALTKSYLAAYPQLSGDQLAVAMQNLFLLYKAEENLTYVGPQVQRDIDRALRAAE